MLLRSSLIAYILASAVTTSVQAEDSHVKKADFDNGTIEPLKEDHGETDLAENGMFFEDDGHGGQRLKLVWKESEYDGTRMERGHEIKHDLSSDSEIFVGFIINVPSPISGSDDDDDGSASGSDDDDNDNDDDSSDSSESDSSESGSSDDNDADDNDNDDVQHYFPNDKKTIVWQLYNWNTDGCSNWTAHLTIENNDLVLHYRRACVDANIAVVMEDLSRDTDFEIIIRAKAGDGNGEFDIFVNGQQRLELRDIGLGFGEFNDDGTLATSVVGTKMGMYCFDVEDYTEDETRTLYFDNMASAKDVDFDEGIDLVNPEY